MRRVYLSNKTDLLFSLCISIQKLYDFPIDTSSFFISVICSWKTAQLRFVLWLWLQAVLVISGLIKIIKKISSKYSLVCFNPCETNTWNLWDSHFQTLLFISKYHQGNKNKTCKIFKKVNTFMNLGSVLL